MSKIATFFVAFAMVACSETEAPQATTVDPVPELSVAEVSSMLSAGELVAIDANNQQTRERHGTLPGARLLTSSSRFDVAAELPADHDTALVFYCANERCNASDGAANRAREAGFASVHVMRDGIAGWKAAGNATNPAS